jgi:hypothetical protein
MHHDTSQPMVPADKGLCLNDYPVALVRFGYQVPRAVTSLHTKSCSFQLTDMSPYMHAHACEASAWVYHGYLLASASFPRDSTFRSHYPRRAPRQSHITWQALQHAANVLLDRIAPIARVPGT